MTWGVANSLPNILSDKDCALVFRAFRVFTMFKKTTKKLHCTHCTSHICSVCFSFYFQRCPVWLQWPQYYHLASIFCPYATNKVDISDSFIAVHHLNPSRRETNYYTRHCAIPSWPHIHVFTHQTYSSSKALHNMLCLLDLIVEFSKGVKVLLHLSLQRRVVYLRSSPGPFRLHDLSLDCLVPVPLLCQVRFQPHHLHLKLFISLLQAWCWGAERRQGERQGRGEVSWFFCYCCCSITDI